MASWTGAAGTSDWYYINHTHLGYEDDKVTSNWDVSPNIPGQGDSISIGSVYTVTNGSGTYGSLTLGTGASLTTNTFLSVSSVANGGSIGVGGGTTAYFVIRGSAATLTGGGTITLMSNDPQHYGTVIGHDDGASLALTNMDNTINGGGSISGYRSGTLTLINNGTINATGNSSNLYGALNIDAAGGVTNNALIEASGSAGLATASNIDNRNGQITVADGSRADLSGVITGGVVSATGSGQINANGATFDGSNSGGIALSGTVNSYGATLNGAVSNAGTINVGTFNYLYTGSAGATLSGGGTITLNGNAAQHYPSVIYGAQNASVILTNVDNTISGGGSISDYRGNALTFINRGTVTATGNSSNGYGDLTIDATGGLTNTGTIEAAVLGSTLNISTGHTVTNNGVLEANGGTLVVADAVSGSGHALITNGGVLQLTAAASFGESVVFQGTGTLALGQSLSTAINGFAVGDTVDLTNISYASGEHMVLQSSSNGVQTYALQNASGSSLSTLNFAGSYAPNIFGVADDGSGHAAITFTAFSNPFLAVSNFGATNAGGGWTSDDTYPRVLGDVNGDGLADVIGFGGAGAYVSLATGGGHFADPFLAVSNFGATNAGGGWSSDTTYPREVADVNGDGLADIIGFGGAGAFVSLATGGGHFANPFLAVSNFGATNAGGGWSSDDTYPRVLGDVNGDGLADIIGFGGAGAYVSLATGGGHFADPFLAVSNFGASGSGGGWTSDTTYPREVADVNGDGLADIVGFGGAGAYVSLATGGGHFADPFLAVSNFGATDSGGGWSSGDTYPRVLADVNGDHMADIIGFGGAGAYVALATGGGHFADPVLNVSNFGATNAGGGWTSQNLYPRTVADVTGDHHADIVGFGGAGVFVSTHV